MEKLQTTLLAREFMKNVVTTGSIAVDATMGRGFDTEFLCQLVGDRGKVYGFDIQEEAKKSTQERLKEAGLLDRAELILKGHEQMEQYIEPNSVDGMMFNFGYLPKATHQICTHANTSIQAITAGLHLLKVGGAMSLCIYQGKDTGFEEKEAILSYLKQISHKQYTVIVTELYNRPNFPPIFAGIVRDR